MGSDANRLALSAGTQIAEYRIERLLGKGGFGLTYLATDTRLEMLVAIKELLPDGIATRIDGSTVVAQTKALEETYSWAVERFEDEARTLAKLSHPNIVRVIRFLETNGTVYVVMEYIQGQSLQRLIEKSGPLNEESARSLLFSVMDGLEYVHRHKILHRDVKPDNIYVTPEGRVLLLDFGSARQDLGRSVSMTALITMGYSPFEQYQTTGKQGAWTDIHALAGTMIYAITGQSPRPAPDRLDSPEPTGWLVNETGNRFSPGFLSALEKGFAVKSADRPQSMDEWRALVAASNPPTIGNLEVPQTTPAPPRLEAPPLPPLKNGSNGKLLPIVTTCAVLLLLAVGVGAFFLFSKPETTVTATPTPVPSIEPAKPTPAPESSPAELFAEATKAETRGDHTQAYGLVQKAAVAGFPPAQSKLGVLYFTGKGVSANAVEAEQWFRKAAEKGDPIAQGYLGQFYLKGTGGLSKNYAQAMEWSRKAAEQGDALGQSNMGEVYRRGLGVAKDFPKSALWLKKAADQGNIDATRQLGQLYYVGGDDFPANEKKAVELIKYAAENGNAQAQVILGIMYEVGVGDLPKDPAKAVSLYLEPANQGNATAQVRMGLAYLNGIGGSPKNPSKAIELFQRAAESGDAEAQFILGKGYADGTIGLPRDENRAAELFQQASDQGHAEAKYQLALSYGLGRGVPKDDLRSSALLKEAAKEGNVFASFEIGQRLINGTGGFAKDETAALESYREAADRGLVGAYTVVGTFYMDGRGGLQRDDVEAAKWFEKGAEAGDGQSQALLGFFNENGRGGIRKNRVKALELYRKAAAQGVEQAQQAVQRLSQ